MSVKSTCAISSVGLEVESGVRLGLEAESDIWHRILRHGTGARNNAVNVRDQKVAATTNAEGELLTLLSEARRGRWRRA